MGVVPSTARRSSTSAAATTRTRPPTGRRCAHRPEPDLARFKDSLTLVTNYDGQPGTDATTYNAGTPDEYTEHCFHNRTLGAEIHFASIVDFKPEFEHIYTGINNKTGGVLFDEKDPDKVWNQDKSATSFYQLCVAQRLVKLACCDGTSTAPCRADHPTGSDAQCTDVAEDNFDQWTPDWDYDYTFFKSVILNVVHRPPSPPPSPPPPSPPPPSPPPSESRCTTRTRTHIHTR